MIIQAPLIISGGDKMLYTINSKDNKLVKMIKSLQQKKHREIEGKYFIEGIKIIAEAVKEKIHLEDVMICPEMLKKIRGGEEFYETLRRSNLSINYVPEKIFNEICSTETPQGILAVIAKNENDFNYENLKPEGFYIVLDRIQDPGNLGTVIRTADAAGVDGIILSEGCVDVHSPKTLRSTMGSIFRVNIYENINLEKALAKMKEIGIRVVAASLEAEKYYYDEDFGNGTALAIGSEAHGVSSIVKNSADCLVKIPMKEQIDSLNASVAAGILIYEKYRRMLRNNEK